jgi:hypothetical protein
MRKVWQMSFTLATVAILSSCSAIDAIANAGRLNSTYELTSVNGNRIPAVLYQEPGYRIEVLNANFTFEENGTYTEAGIVRETVNGFSTTRGTSTYGYYDYYNGELTFDERGGRRYYGYLDGGTLTVEDQGVRMTYRRY